MTRTKLLAAVLLVAGLVTGGVLAQRANTPNKNDEGRPTEGASKKPPGDASFSRFYVHVEAHGILNDTDTAVTVTALRRFYTVSEPDKEIPALSADQTWSLDFARSKDLRQAAKRLDGKAVLVTGWGELRQLVQRPESAAGSSFGRTPFQPPGPHWIVHDTIIVTDLRLTDAE